MLSQDQVREIRRDFPILATEVGRYPLAYLDNAATTQKPRAVLDALNDYYLSANANPHRGAHQLANRATELYEQARRRVAQLIHAYRVSEVIFSKSATESLNLLAYTLEPSLKPGDEILISILEHHANLIPWQFVAQRTGAKLVYCYLDENREIDEDDYLAKLNEKTKIVALTACSNVTGTRPALSQYFAKAKEYGALTIADLTQLVPHAPSDVREIGCDFGAFSGHKMYAPMGIGVLWGRYSELEKLPPFHYGGDMIESVTEQSAVFARPATRFEAGTMNVEAAVGLMAAINYMEGIGLEAIDQYEQHLTDLAIASLRDIPGLSLYAATGEDRPHGAVVPFTMEGAHPHDIATIVNERGIAIRAGHHCAEPLHHYLGLNSTCRASFSFYNTEEEVARLAAALREVPEVLGLAL